MTINFFFLCQLFMNYLYRIKIDNKKEIKMIDLFVFILYLKLDILLIKIIIILLSWLLIYNSVLPNY